LVSLSPEAPIGELRGVPEIHTNAEERPIITLPMSAEVKGEIDISPERFFFGYIERGRVLSRKVTVFSRGGKSFTVLKAESTLEFLSIWVHEVESGKNYEVVATIEGDAPPRKD